MSLTSLHHRLKPQIKILFGLFCCCAVIFLASAAPAFGGGSPDSAQWEIKFDFTKGKINAALTVFIGQQTENGFSQIFPSKTIDIPCEQIGDLTMTVDGLVFDGNGYLECDMPSIADAVFELTLGKIELAPHCICQTLWADGQMMISPSNVTETPLSIFHHPDIELSTTLEPQGQQAQLGWQIDDGFAVSHMFDLSHKIDHYRVWTKRSEEPFDYSTAFYVNQYNMEGTDDYDGNPLEISTGEATIYLGYNPDGNHFQGTIRELIIDPPCIAGGI